MLESRQWNNGAPRGTVVRVSEKGYINKELFFGYHVSSWTVSYMTLPAPPVPG